MLAIKNFFAGLRSNRLHLVAFIVAILLIAAVIGVGVFISVKKSNISSTSIFESKVEWANYTDTHGFSVHKPQDWKVSVNNWGLVEIGPESSNQEFFALTIAYPQTTTHEQVLSDVGKYFEETFAGFQVVSQKSLSDYDSILCNIGADGNLVGVLNVSGSDKNYYISGVISPQDQLEASQKDLLKVASSFTYDNSLKDPTQFTDVTTMVSWTDPVENAFTVDVPSDWNVSGGISRPYIDYVVTVDATKGDSGVRIEIPHDVYYMSPETAALSGCNKIGVLCGSPAMIPLPQMSAQEYLTDVIASSNGLTIDSMQPRDDIVSAAPKTGQIITAAEAQMSGDGKVHRYVATTLAWPKSIWVAEIIQYWAPENEIAQVEKIANSMIESFKMNPIWYQNEQNQVLLRANIVFNSASEVSDMISSAYKYQSAVQDEARLEWSNAMLGTQSIYDSTIGDGYIIPVGAQSYWESVISIEF